MVPWQKRLVYGVFGWLVATCATAFFTLIWMVSRSPIKQSGSLSHVLHGVSEAFLAFLLSASAVSIFGWLLGLPYVLLVRTSRGWRFWAYLALGSGIGPALLLIRSLYSFLTRTAFDGVTDYIAVSASAMLSCLTTLIYLLLLRRAQTD